MKIPTVPSPENLPVEPAVRALMRSMIAAVDRGDAEDYWKLIELFISLHKPAMKETECEFHPPSGVDNSSPSKPVQVERELFEWLVDYALELRGEWFWKRNTIPRNNSDMSRLDKYISAAIKLRDSQ